jgi:hypothetical protein
MLAEEEMRRRKKEMAKAIDATKTTKRFNMTYRSSTSFRLVYKSITVRSSLLTIDLRPLIKFLLYSSEVESSNLTNRRYLANPYELVDSVRLFS